MVGRLNDRDFPNVREVTLKEYNLIQIEHILKHKWYMSEQAGMEIDIKTVMDSWLNDGYAREFRKKFKVIT